MPADREADAKYPVLFELIPYRKDEGRHKRFKLFSYFVKQGYVVVRADIRGTGTSEGKLPEYEYSDQELNDGEAVIDWLSKQPWSTGSVGMFGISWGAFNSIQMAMRNPPALKAIIAIMGTDDLFHDDVHFIDGMMHVDSYEIGQDMQNILPAPPEYALDEAYFHDRFDTEPWLLQYKRQQRDGPFWNRASLNSDYSSIRVPTFVIGGWYDGYRDSVPRMLEKLEAPVKGIVGPWRHTWPNLPGPELGIEWRREAVRWLDHWMQDKDTGIMDEPGFAVYVREKHPPAVIDEAPGYWRWEDGWPIDRTEKRALYALADHSLSDVRPVGNGGQIHKLRYIPTVGVEASGKGNWWGDIPWDQRGTDAYRSWRFSAFPGQYCMCQRMLPWPIGSCVFPTSHPMEPSPRWEAPVLAEHTGIFQRIPKRWCRTGFICWSLIFTLLRGCSPRDTVSAWLSIMQPGP